MLAILVLLNSIVLVTIYNLKSFLGYISTMLNDRMVSGTDIDSVQDTAIRTGFYLEGLFFCQTRENIPEQIK